MSPRRIGCWQLKQTFADPMHDLQKLRGRNTSEKEREKEKAQCLVKEKDERKGKDGRAKTATVVVKDWIVKWFEADRALEFTGEGRLITAREQGVDGLLCGLFFPFRKVFESVVHPGVQPLEFLQPSVFPPLGLLFLALLLLFQQRCRH